MLVSTAIIVESPHGFGNIEISQSALTRLFTNQHTEAVFDLGFNKLTPHLGVDGMTLQAELELAAGRDTQAATYLHWDNDLAFIGNGDDWHGSALLLHGKNILAQGARPATDNLIQSGSGLRRGRASQLGSQAGLSFRSQEGDEATSETDAFTITNNDPRPLAR
ncbi:MAG TPA: hypothetical protein VMV40_09105 [Acidiferrobacter sp.]|nr:hypothetical protein [Acidiferrobacter sp.]